MNASPDMLNCYVFEGTLRKRFGFSQFPSAHAAIGTTVTGLYSTQDDEDNTHLIATHNTGVAKWNAGSWDVITGTALTGGTEPMDFETSQNSIVFSQGVDAVNRHDISTASTVYAVLNASCPPARYLTRFTDRLVLGYTEESGNTKPYRIRRSISGNHADWTGTGSGFTDMTEYPYEIRGLKKLGDRMAIYSRSSIHIATKTGIAAAPYTIDIVTGSVGLLSARSVQEFPGAPAHIFLGNDDVYIFNGANVRPVAVNVRDLIYTSLSPEAFRRNFSTRLTDTQEMLFFVATGANTDPDTVWAYNYGRDIWYPWSVSGMTCATLHRNDDTTTIDELVGTIDAQLWTFDSRVLLNAFPILLTGRNDGKIYSWRSTYLSDNGAAIACRWTSRDFEHDDLDPGSAPSQITLRSLGVTYLNTGAVCTLQVSYSVNGGETWQGPFPLTLPIGTGGVQEAVQHKQVTGKRIRFRIENTTTNEAFYILEFNPIFEMREENTP